MAESQFPMSFDKCPNCGCTETVTQIAWDEEVEKGRVAKDTLVAAQHLKIPLLDPVKPPIIIGGVAGILFMNVDACRDCGTLYCSAATVGEGNIQAGPPPGQGQQPSFSPS